MRFLLDECLSARLAGLLKQAGHDAVHVADLGLLGAVDDDVMAAAVSSRRILVSADTDFGELLARSGAGLPSVVLLRRPQRQPEDQAAVLIANMPTLTDELKSGALVVIMRDRLRIRTLPLRVHRRTSPSD